MEIINNVNLLMEKVAMKMKENSISISQVKCKLISNLFEKVSELQINERLLLRGAKTRTNRFIMLLVCLIFCLVLFVIVWSDVRTASDIAKMQQDLALMPDPQWIKVGE